MSYTQFGYTYSPSSQILMTGQTSCCETNQNGMAADPHTAQSPTVCSLPAAYDSRLLSTYPRLATGLTVYGSTYADQAGYVAALGSHPTSFYPTLSSPYDLKDGRTTWPTLPQAAAACYAYDTTALTNYGPYGDRYDTMDSAARRKNATRETTNTLKAWLYEHRKNPYPTKGEKIMLAIITKMTLTQVSTWFANARRRLKKENKMTWEPKNKTSDMADTDDKSEGTQTDDEINQDKEDGEKPAIKNNTNEVKKEESDNEKPSEETTRSSERNIPTLLPLSNNCQMRLSEFGNPSSPPMTKLTPELPVTEKPKIWSLAQTAISDTVPTRKMAFDVPASTDMNYSDRTPSVSPSSTSGYWTPTGSLRSVEQTSEIAMQEDNSAVGPRLAPLPPLEYSPRLQFPVKSQDSVDDVNNDATVRTLVNGTKYSTAPALLRFPSNYHLDTSLTPPSTRATSLGWLMSDQKEREIIRDTRNYVTPHQVPVTIGNTTAFKPVSRSEQPIV